MLLVSLVCWTGVFIGKCLLVLGIWVMEARGDSEGSIGSLNKRMGKLLKAFCHNARGNPENLV